MPRIGGVDISNKTSDKNVLEYKVELNRNKSIEILKESLNKIEIRGEQLYLLKQAIKNILQERCNIEYYKLCYIDGNKAWFTDNFEKQWGDDWNDRPYECNAGYPYDYWSELIEDNLDIFERKWKHNPIKLKTLYFEVNDWGDKRPHEMGNFSVEDINKGAVAWIHTDDYNIYAGTTMEEFIDVIEKHGGQVYLLKEE